MNFNDLVNGPIFAVFGVPAVLTYDGGTVLELIAVDKTKGVEVADNRLNIVSVAPVAALRAADLAGVDLGLLDGGSIALNGVTWRIHQVMERPTPYGAADGQIWLILTAI